MSYGIKILIYNNGCEIDDNQGYKYKYEGYDDVGRTNNPDDLVRWLKNDLPDREREGLE